MSLYPSETVEIQTSNVYKTHPYFEAIVSAVKSSPYFVKDFTSACLVIPNFDHTCALSQSDHPYRVGAYLRSLPLWNGGRNFLLFDFHDNDDMEVDVGMAIGAKLGWSKYHFRDEFDIAFPPPTRLLSDDIYPYGPWEPIDEAKYLAVFR